MAGGSGVTICSDCKGVGYCTVTISVVHDGAWLPDYIDVNCECNPPATDCDAPHWAAGEPRGTAPEDFHPFRDGQYAGL
jgi:hypothetical protein